jgi:hemerythrin-like domain-containing protein
MAATPLQILQKEHQIVQDIMLVLSHEGTILREGRSYFLSKLKEIIKSITRIMDVHHRKEMEAFAMLANYSDVTKEQLVDILKEEHDLGYHYLAQMIDLIDAPSHDDKMRRESLPPLIEKYNDHLTAHLKKEDIDFFPLIEQALSEDDQTQLAEKYHKIEKDFNNRRAIWIIQEAKSQVRL